LAVEDDENHEAIKATWTHSRDVGDDAPLDRKGVTESKLEQVIDALAKLGGQSTIANLKPELRWRWDAVKAALSELKARNYVTHVSDREGWRLDDALFRARKAELSEKESRIV
jgi:hypothetical protein